MVLTITELCDALGCTRFDVRAMHDYAVLPSPGRGSAGAYSLADAVAVAYGSLHKRAGVHLAGVAQVVKRIRELPADEFARAIEGRTIVVPTPNGPALVVHLADDQPAPTGMLLRTVHRATVRAITSLRGAESRGRSRQPSGAPVP